MAANSHRVAVSARFIRSITMKGTTATAATANPPASWATPSLTSMASRSARSTSCTARLNASQCISRRPTAIPNTSATTIHFEGRRSGGMMSAVAHSARAR